MQDSFGLEHVQVGRRYALCSGFTNRYRWSAGEVFLVDNIEGSTIRISFINDRAQIYYDTLDINDSIQVLLVFLNSYSTDDETRTNLRYIRDNIK